MKTIDLFIETIFDLLTFKSVTTFNRWFEIGCGILTWMQIGIIIWGILK